MLRPCDRLRASGILLPLPGWRNDGVTPWMSSTDGSQRLWCSQNLDQLSRSYGSVANPTRTETVRLHVAVFASHDLHFVRDVDTRERCCFASHDSVATDGRETPDAS